MSKRLFKTMVAVLAIAAAAAGPVRGQTTYNVTFGGFSNQYMNTTVNVASLPQTFTEIGGYYFYPWQVISDEGGCEFTSVSVTSDGNGKVSANMVDWSEMTITVSGTFEGTATIHVEGYDPENGDVSRDITVSCVAPPVPITVRMAAGTEDAANWSLASGNASVPGNLVLENVMSGSQVTATYNGTTKKVKSVKAVKYVAPTITVDGLVLNGQEGDSWETLAANNPEKLTIVEGYVMATETSATLTKQGHFVGKTATYSSSNTYEWLNTIIVGDYYAAFYYHSGETWAQAINADRAINAGYSWEIDEGYVKLWGGETLLGNGTHVSGSSPIDPMTAYTIQGY